MRSFITFMHGILIGIANIIPGLSGGTIAYMVGIYERFITILGNPKIVLKNKSDGIFILFLGSGIFLGLLGFASIFTIILGNVSLKQHFYFFVIGTIIGTIVYTLKTEKGFSLKNLLVFAIVIIVFFLIEIIKPPFDSKSPEVVGVFLGEIKLTKIDFLYGVWLAICGLLAASSMLLPGFSGSALLVSLGEYENIMGFVDERMIIPIGIIGIGAVLGILYCSRLISKLMKKYGIQMIYVIVALMVTSIYKLFSEISGEFLTSQVAISIITCIIGYFAAFLLSSKKDA